MPVRVIPRLIIFSISTELEPINPHLGTDTSGICLVSLNDPQAQEQLQNVVLPRQYLLNIELGKATDNR